MATRPVSVKASILVWVLLQAATAHCGSQLDRLPSADSHLGLLIFSITRQGNISNFSLSLENRHTDKQHLVKRKRLPAFNAYSTVTELMVIALPAGPYRWER
jgi:hypothetical protein